MANRGQNGATRFLQRFALRPHGAYDQTAAMKFALEFQNPLVAAPIIGTTNSPYPATNHSLLAVSNPNVLLWALKPHDDGIEHGFVARVWNQASTPMQTRLSPSTPMANARRLTHIETPIEPLAVTNGALEVTVPAQRIESFGLKLQ